MKVKIDNFILEVDNIVAIHKSDSLPEFTIIFKGGDSSLTIARDFRRNSPSNSKRNYAQFDYIEDREIWGRYQDYEEIQVIYDKLMSLWGGVNVKEEIIDLTA